MKRAPRFLALVLAVKGTHAQGTAFAYQGRLNLRADGAPFALMAVQNGGDK